MDLRDLLDLKGLLVCKGHLGHPVPMGRRDQEEFKDHLDLRDQKDQEVWLDQLD